MIGTSRHTRIAGAVLALAVLGASASTARADVVTDGLTGYWTFDDANAADALGAHAATIYGAPATGVAGVDGSAFRFNGAGDGITINNSDHLLSPGGGDFTVSLWFRVDSPSNSLLFMNYSGLVYYGIYAEPDGTLEAFARDSARRFSDIITTTNLADGQWHHLAYVRQGSQFLLYVDCGVAGEDDEVVGSVTNNSPWVHVASANTNCSGCTNAGDGPPNSQFFAGSIDDLALYNRALSADEVAHNGTTASVVCGCALATSCPDGQNCGTASDNCGGSLECGTCSGQQTCGGGGAADVCGCTPATTCPAGVGCGTAPDGCGGTIQCGGCAQTCAAHDGGASCVCGAGYVLDGDHRSCDDIVAPTVVITSPLAGANLYGHTGTALIGVATDSGTGVASATFTIDGSVTVPATSGGNGAWTGAASFAMSSLAYGAHTVKLTAVDHAGNAAGSATVAFVVAAPPTVVFVTPLNGEEVAGSEVIVADATGHGFDLTKVTISASNSHGTRNAICTATPAAGQLRCTWTQLNVAALCPAAISLLGLNIGGSPCPLTLTAVATDTSGQTGSAVSSVTVVQSDTAIAAATNGNNLLLTVTNLNLAFNHVQCSVNGVLLPAVVSLGSTSISDVGVPAGPLLVICTWTGANGLAQVDAVTLAHPSGGIAVTVLTPIVDLLAILL